MKKILITGGTGFIGQALFKMLSQQDYQITVIGREPKPGRSNYLAIDLERNEPPVEIIDGLRAVIHLVGSPIFRRWTPAIKESIYNSRVASTRHLVAAIKKAKKRPASLITASATGYYGDQGETELTELAPAGVDFLAKVCLDWEAAAQEANQLGVRTVQVRTAPVLGRGGLLELLGPLYQSGLGGPIGPGQAWFPWIHHTDIVGIYRHCLERESIAGPVNAVPPELVRYEEFSKLLAKALGRPHFTRIPQWLASLVMGELGQSVANSQKVIPQVLATTHYQWRFANLPKALKQIFG